jgi:alanyl-tRNA synthetase
MKRLTSAETRNLFLDYFRKRGHEVVLSSSLVPANDPSLLFANAGMVQFKDVFLGLDKRPYQRATTSQKCMRISGKHNDLENVGPSPRHHTFFEMLGNFSFGDYFKQDAIRYAYELMTKVYGIPEEKLHFTVYKDDDEAFDVWVNGIGAPVERVHRMGPKTNFWQMAETGPCGPTSEIHYDWGAAACTCQEPDCGVPLDNGCARWLEVWNLVFMQYNRTQPDPAHSGKYDEPLPSPGVDTGMGLERLLSVLNDAQANYDTDLFTDIMDATQEILGHSDAFRAENIVAYRVIADHCRAVSFLIADGVNPGTTGREYITRMLIRRAWRFAHKMGVENPFLVHVAEAVIAKMADVYPELEQFREAIQYQIGAEESRFMRMLDNSLNILEDMIEGNELSVFSGESAFFLYDTHGLPLEITRDILKERNLEVDEEGFHKALNVHSEMSGRKLDELDDPQVYLELVQKLGTDVIDNDPYDYDHLAVSSKVLAIVFEGKVVQSATKGQSVEIVLDKTPFYVESGGQISDTGILFSDAANIVVQNVTKPVGSLIVHSSDVSSGKISTGDLVTASVDESRRWDIMRNHTATHLLHASLRQVLGNHVQQKGSLVAPDRLRFDFTHNDQLTDEQIREVAGIVNSTVLRNAPVVIAEKPLAEAKREGAMALFEEKYSSIVRTVTVKGEDQSSSFSYELCGGTHVSMTGQIGPCLIISVESSGAGVRRIVAVTGRHALALIDSQEKRLRNLADQLSVSQDRLESRVDGLLQELRETKLQLTNASAEVSKSSVDDLLKQAKTMNGYTLIVGSIEHANRDQLDEIVDLVREKMESGIVVLAGEDDGKVLLTAKITSDLQKRGLHAGKLVGDLARMVGGKGGGRTDFARAGGTQPEKLSEALAQVEVLVTHALS